MVLNKLLLLFFLIIKLAKPNGELYGNNRWLTNLQTDVYIQEPNTQVKALDLNVSGNVSIVHVFYCTSRWLQLKMATVLSGCDGKTFVGAMNDQFSIHWWKWHFSKLVYLKFCSVTFLSLTKWMTKSENLLFRWTSLNFSATSIDKFTYLRSDGRFMIRKPNDKQIWNVKCILYFFNRFLPKWMPNWISSPKTYFSVLYFSIVSI